jgi:leader peptidase (prepilin peptidase) / N-methyltransferase
MIYFFCIMLAAALGSFANVLIYRLPLMILSDAPISLAQPASHCPHCKAPIKWRYNLPLLGFIALKGRCAACHASIPRRYFLVELSAVLLAVLCLVQWGVSCQAAAYFIFLLGLWALSWIDAAHYLLPDVLTQGLLWLGLLYNALAAPNSLSDMVFAAALGYGLLYAVYFVYFKITGKAGLGFGDMKLLAAIGAWLGANAMLNVLLLACLSALLFGVVGALLRRAVLQKIWPFGPFLALAAAIVLFTGADFTVLWSRL